MKKKETEQKKQADAERIIELTDTLKRVQAEFENYKKRTEKENVEFIKSASKTMIMKLLPILDNFELAIMNKESKDDFIKGVELIYSELFTLLEAEGLKRIEAQGNKFDPYMHEALLTEKSECDNETVTEELQKGYTLNDKVIRHTKVKICKK